MDYFTVVTKQGRHVYQARNSRHAWLLAERDGYEVLYIETEE